MYHHSETLLSTLLARFPIEKQQQHRNYLNPFHKMLEHGKSGEIMVRITNSRISSASLHWPCEEKLIIWQMYLFLCAHHHELLLVWVSLFMKRRWKGSSNVDLMSISFVALWMRGVVEWRSSAGGFVYSYNKQQCGHWASDEHRKIMTRILHGKNFCLDLTKINYYSEQRMERNLGKFLD